MLLCRHTPGHKASGWLWLLVRIYLRKMCWRRYPSRWMCHTFAVPAEHFWPKVFSETRHFVYLLQEFYQDFSTLSALNILDQFFPQSISQEIFPTNSEFMSQEDTSPIYTQLPTFDSHVDFLRFRNSIASIEIMICQGRYTAQDILYCLIQSLRFTRNDHASVPAIYFLLVLFWGFFFFKSFHIKK